MQVRNNCMNCYIVITQWLLKNLWYQETYKSLLVLIAIFFHGWEEEFICIVFLWSKLTERKTVSFLRTKVLDVVVQRVLIFSGRSISSIASWHCEMQNLQRVQGGSLTHFRTDILEQRENPKKNRSKKSLGLGFNFSVACTGMGRNGKL